MDFSSLMRALFEGGAIRQILVVCAVVFLVSILKSDERKHDDGPRLQPPRVLLDDNGVDMSNRHYDAVVTHLQLASRSASTGMSTRAGLAAFTPLSQLFPSIRTVTRSEHRSWDNTTLDMYDALKPFLNPHRRYSEHDHFIPYPKVTFLSDNVRTLVCQICRDSVLRINATAFPLPGRNSDTIPAILPCSHVFGSVCLETWTRTNRSCPSCRLSLVHRVCRHPLLPRHLGRQELMSLPPTIPEGGKVGSACLACRAEIDMKEAEAEALEAARLYRLQRHIFSQDPRGIERRDGDAQFRREVLRRKLELDDAYLDFMQYNFFERLHRQW